MIRCIELRLKMIKVIQNMFLSLEHEKSKFISYLVQNFLEFQLVLYNNFAKFIY